MKSASCGLFPGRERETEGETGWERAGEESKADPANPVAAPGAEVEAEAEAGEGEEATREEARGPRGAEAEAGEGPEGAKGSPTALPGSTRVLHRPAEAEAIRPPALQYWPTWPVWPHL